MDVSSLVKSLRKEIGCESFLTSKHTKVSHFIDTGSYALNRIMSGDMINGGVPAGRVLVMAGEKSTGKSLISAQIAINAINKSKYDLVVLFDTEGGILKKFFEACGVDMRKIEYALIDSIEDCTVNTLKLMRAIKVFKESHPKFKCLYVLDSMGAMTSTGFIDNALKKGKQVGDMGLRAKSLNAFAKSITVPALRADIPAILLNHVYCDPAAMFKSKIQNQSGGEGAQYMGTINLQSTRTLVSTNPKPKKGKGGESDDGDSGEEDMVETCVDKDAKPDESFYKGSWLNFFSIKNRIVKPFHEAKVYVDFSKGLSKYGGLFDLAVKYDCIKIPAQGWYEVPTFAPGKKLRKTEISSPEIWESFIKILDERARKDICYCEKDNPDDFNGSDEAGDSDATDDISKAVEEVKAAAEEDAKEIKAE